MLDAWTPAHESEELLNRLDDNELESSELLSRLDDNELLNENELEDCCKPPKLPVDDDDTTPPLITSYSIKAVSCCWYSAERPMSTTLSETSNVDGMNVTGLNVSATHESAVETLTNNPSSAWVINSARMADMIVYEKCVLCVCMCCVSVFIVDLFDPRMSPAKYRPRTVPTAPRTRTAATTLAIMIVVWEMAAVVPTTVGTAASAPTYVCFNRFLGADDGKRCFVDIFDSVYTHQMEINVFAVLLYVHIIIFNIIFVIVCIA